MPASIIVDNNDSASRHSSQNGVPDSPAPSTSDRPIFPLLQNNATTDSIATGSTVVAQPSTIEDDNDEEPAIAKPFGRGFSPNGKGGPRRTVEDEEDGTPPREVDGKKKQRLTHRMHKYDLYETSSRYYLVGGDITEKRFRILKIDRNDDTELSITDDKTVYTRKEMNQLLDTIDDGNKGTGGIKLRCTTWGLLGFIRFTGHFYMLLITKKRTVAMIGGHLVYQIDGTELIPLASRLRTDHKSGEESRYLAILKSLDMNRSFYFSYSYDITHTLQHNIAQERSAMLKRESYSCDDDVNSMFVWNDYLLRPVMKTLSSPFDWCRPIIHGYMSQASVDIYGRKAYIAIIARRSRYFAGARFLKRGANDLGYVANDVETEQIVSEVSTTSFHAPGPKFFASPQYTSYVQHRGSIPLYWTQDNTGVTPKPPIQLNLVDPFYSAAALHFDNLFERYGAPIYVLNLVKARERTPRESKLLDEFTKAITYLNQFLPEEKKLIHHPWDMSRASKSDEEDVFTVLDGIAEGVIRRTGFFQNGDGTISPILAQNGIARTNCIDCLDRTNTAQFVIAKCALGHQLHALGIIEETTIKVDTDVGSLFTQLFHEHGDMIARQYGGSQLVNTMETYRKINHWTSHSRDMIESFKRYYTNSFLDAQRQEAYNLFLGNYIYTEGQPMLWELASDYYLHHGKPRGLQDQIKRDYINWYTPNHLKARKVPSFAPLKGEAAKRPASYFDNYWLEYYRPFVLSSFGKMFAYKMFSTISFIPLKSSQEGRYDLSPFKPRDEANIDAGDKKKGKKEVIVVSPREDKRFVADDDTASIMMSARSTNAARGIRGWLHPNAEPIPHDLNGAAGAPGIVKDGTEPVEFDQPKVKPTSLEKTRAAQWSFTQMVQQSLNPSVNERETADYTQYLNHPQNIPLVVSADIPVEDDNEYLEYINASWQTEGLMPTNVDEDVAVYSGLLTVGENPLTVTEGDALKKRYKAYRKWLRGKSLFKQQPVD